MLWRGRNTRLLSFAAPLLLLVAIRVVIAGGDHFPYWRLLVPVLPISAILFACALEEFSLGYGGRGEGPPGRAQQRDGWLTPSLKLGAVLLCGSFWLLPGLSQAPLVSRQRSRLICAPANGHHL